MYLSCTPILKKRQRGAAFMVMLIILVLGAATVLVTSLNSTGAKIERDVKTTEALALARDTLISEAAIEVDLANHHYPGSLPCPDTNNDGSADAGGNGIDCSQYIGRLPWKTLGLPDLRDASGEQLWYTLSRNVRRYASVIPLNSDTAVTNDASNLNVSGPILENNLLAIVFAPGDNVSGQSRSGNTAACSTTGDSREENRCAANYLEGSNSNQSDNTTQNLNYENKNAAVQLNDRLVTVSRDQLMERTEKRVGGEIRNILKTYYDAWGAFPFPVPFNNPSTSTFNGQQGYYEGLLPIGNLLRNATSLSWNTSPAPHYYIDGVDSGTCYFDSGAVSNSRLRCISSSITISAGATVTFTGTLLGVGFGFWRPHNLASTSEFRVRDNVGSNVLASDKFVNPTITRSLNSNGSATITFSGIMKSGTTTERTIQRIEFRDIQRYDATYIPAWLVSETNDESPNCDPNFDSCNDWYKLAYYAVADEYAPGGDHTCTPTPCLTVNGQNGGSNVPAAVVMSGRTLAGAHPSGTLSDYLEGENQTTGDRTFENQTRSTTFNDQVIIISP